MANWVVDEQRQARRGKGQRILVVQEMWKEVAVGKGDAVVAEDRGSGDRC